VETVLMDEDEADRWIEELGSSFEHPASQLEALGEPALRRLFDACEGVVRVPLGQWPQDALTNRAQALGHLGKICPEVLLELVRGKKYLKLATIQGLGFTGDERLQAIAKEALKVFGDDF
jgi:hypothetical protein